MTAVDSFNGVANTVIITAASVVSATTTEAWVLGRPVCEADR